MDYVAYVRLQIQTTLSQKAAPYHCTSVAIMVGIGAPPDLSLCDENAKERIWFFVLVINYLYYETFPIHPASMMAMMILTPVVLHNWYSCHYFYQLFDLHLLQWVMHQ